MSDIVRSGVAIMEENICENPPQILNQKLLHIHPL